MPLQLRSLVRPVANDTSGTGELQLSLVEVPMPEPISPDQLVVRVEAAPMNPSDLGLLFGGADMDQATSAGSAERPVVTAPIAPNVLKALAGRAGQSMPVGNEGAGTVVSAGSSPAAQALLGKKVAAIGGAMFSEYCAVGLDQVLVLPDGVTATTGASSFVNPLTALGMVETMRKEGHSALVHTAAASNLGQMLSRICLKDEVGLVNVVRKPEQAALLRGQGARYVVDSSSPRFMAELTEAIAETGATLAFDAVSGGKLAGQILLSMERAIQRRPGQSYSRYGSSIHKQVYCYGMLDQGPMELTRGAGMAWSVGGWLLSTFLQRAGSELVDGLKARVAAELQTTFLSSYTEQLTLAQALSLEALSRYRRTATGEKVLLTPSAA